MAGVELSGSPDFLKGSTINTCLMGADREKELEKMKSQIENGIKPISSIRSASCCFMIIAERKPIEEIIREVLELRHLIYIIFYALQAIIRVLGTARRDRTCMILIPCSLFRP
jgi:hypothetical protein